MDDTAAIWAEAPDRETMLLETGTGSVRRLAGLAQHMVSGDIAAAAVSAGVNHTGVGALGVAAGHTYSVRVARDRLLVVTNGDVTLRPGWNDSGYAVSDMSAIDVFEIEGALAEEIVNRATTLPLSGAGPSAAIIFAHVEVYLYRHMEHDTIRVHVDPSMTSYVWDWFKAVLIGMPTEARTGDH